MTDKRTPCETLKSIVDSQTLEVRAEDIVKATRMMVETQEIVKNLKLTFITGKHYLTNDQYWYLSTNIATISDWLQKCARMVELPAHYKPMIKELIEQAQK